MIRGYYFRQEQDKIQEVEPTFKMPKCLTIFADTNVAATPIKAHNPLKPPIIDGFKPEIVNGSETFEIKVVTTSRLF